MDILKLISHKLFNTFYEFDLSVGQKVTVLNKKGKRVKRIVTEIVGDETMILFKLDKINKE